MNTRTLEIQDVPSGMQEALSRKLSEELMEKGRRVTKLPLTNEEAEALGMMNREQRREWARKRIKELRKSVRGIEL